MGSSQGSSQASIFSAWTGSDLSSSVTHRVLGNVGASLPQDPDPMDPGLGHHCQLHLAPAGSVRAAPGRQDLSVTQAVSSAVDHVAAAPAKGPGHLTSQGLAIYPRNAPSSSSAGCVLEGTASQRDSRLPQTPAPLSKIVRGGCSGTGQSLSQQVPEAPWACPLLTSGQRQLHAGVAPSNSGMPCGPGPAREISCGGRLTCGRLSEQPPSGQCKALASCGHSQRAWAVKEQQVQLWAAEILLALEGLHQQGVLCRDLNPRNLLLDAGGR